MLESKIEQLKQLTESLDVNKENPEGKLLVELVKVMDIMADEIVNLKKALEEMEEYVSVIDGDLLDVQEEYYGYEDESYTDDDFVEIQCDHCKETIFIDKSILKNDEKLQCPNCSSPLNFKSHNEHVDYSD